MALPWSPSAVVPRTKNQYWCPACALYVAEVPGTPVSHGWSSAPSSDTITS